MNDFRHSWRACSITSLLLAIALLAPSQLVCGDDFPEPNNTQDPKDQLADPAKLVAGMKVPPGFQLSLFAAEPQVQQPVAITTDGRGRLWVAEMYTYAESQVNFDSRLRDRIVILADTDHDGRADERKVFWSGGQKLSAVAVGFGGVWALCAPQLLFIPDRDGDDRPDGEPIVVLDGWNDGPVRHNIVNGLTLGPDGWLYGRHGILATSRVGKPGTPDSRRTALNCAIWRYHPTREQFEVVCQGTTNPWGFDYDQHGEMFFINTVIGHLWHAIPGAYYRRMYGEHFDPHVYGVIEQHADHFHWDTREAWSDIRKTGVTDGTDKAGGGHAHVGLMIYQGDNWPAEYRHQLFTLNLHGTRINRDRLERSGSGYVGRHAPDLLHANNPWFRGIELIYGQDGGVYIADWADVGECHENDGVHRTSGRIYKLTYGQPSKPVIPNVDRLSAAELVQLQLHENEWYGRQARRVLQERAAAGMDLQEARQQLEKMLVEHPQVTRQLRALWSLHVSGGVADERLHQLLKHENEHLRAWAVRLLADDGQLTPVDIEKLAAHARTESSALVRLYLASTLQRLPVAARQELARALVAHPADAQDHNLPLLVWYGIEPLVAESPAAAVTLLEQTRWPTLRQFITRRLVEEIERQPASVNQILELAARGGLELQRDVLEGVTAGLRGWRKAPQPAAWQAFQKAVNASGDDMLISRTRELGVVFGDGRAMEEIRRIALDGAQPGDARRAALQTVIAARPADLPQLLQQALGDRALAGVAARGLAAFDNPQTPKQLLDRWHTFGAEDQRGVLETLVSRPQWAESLLAAIESGRLRRADLTAWHARQIRSFNRPELSQKLVAVWGEVRDSSAEKQELLLAQRQALTSTMLAKANVESGRAVFQKNCANCHTLFGQGGAIGPDLTGGNRKNLEYLLENIIDPSASVAADYRISVVQLSDGRVLNGIVSGTTERILTLQTATEKMVLPRSEVEAITPAKLSLMPDNLLSNLTAEQIRDLFGYLMR
jgi:putative membrane-bound dehydrogenase-like protein